MIFLVDFGQVGFELWSTAEKYCRIVRKKSKFFICVGEFNNLMNNMFFRIDYISRRRRIGRSRKCKSITILSINFQNRYESIAAAAGGEGKAQKI